jgi:DNA-directed RNA polymerase specialized sigma24 family protein
MILLLARKYPTEYHSETKKLTPKRCFEVIPWMSSAGSVTELIGRLQAGDASAAQQLWDLYLPRLLGLARHKLPSQALGIADEEDVVLSAFASFFFGAEHRQFTQLHDRDDLWHLLAVITTRKAIDLVKREGRQKRDPCPRPGGKPPQGLPSASAEQPEIEQILDPLPSPALAAVLDEACQRLLESLADAQLRSVAVWKLEGYTSAEIAGMLGCTVRTIERKLRLIRSIWSQESAS